MKTAVFAGSFDPITNGHMDIILRAATIFGKVIVAISPNSEKKYFISETDRFACVSEAVSHLENVTVMKYTGLLADFVKKHNGILVKGARNATDFDYEKQLYMVNNKISGIETIIFPANSQTEFISSSFVRELIKYDASTNGYMPECVKKYIKAAR